MVYYNMPKERRGRTTRGKNRLTSPTGTKGENIKDLKKKVCTMILELIKSGGRFNIIFNYLKMIQVNKGIHESKIPSIDEISGDLNSGLRELVFFRGRLIGTPSLNQSEQNNIYLTSEEAKKVQLKKDDWLQRFTDSDSKNIMEWLKDDSIKEIFELTSDDPETPRPSMESSEDKWEDISVIYNNTIAYLRGKEEEASVTELLSKIPSNLPLTHISINVGKISDYQLFIIEMGESLLKRSSSLAQNLTTILGKLGLVTLKIGGYTMAITTKFISDLFINIFQNNIHPRLWSIISMAMSGIFNSPFVISDNKKEIQSKIDHKYRLFLCLIVIKTIFMLGNLIFETEVIDSVKLRQLMNFGIELLNTYIADRDYNSLPFIQDKFPGIRRQIDDIMNDMNKLTEWYLLRKTIVFDINSNKLLLLENKKELREMSAAEIDRMALEPEPEPEDETAAKRKKKKSKRKRKSSKKKKKQKKKTKRRK